MDAIRELQRQLREAQQVSNAKRITERNCVDLVQKLIEQGQVQLLHTASGREWLTPAQLDVEIRNALAACGGRLNILDLPGEVGVAPEHCDYLVDVICKRESGFLRIQSSLMTRQYLHSVAQEIEAELQQAGCLPIADLAMRYSLPTDFVRDSLLPLLNSSSGASQHTVKTNTVYTASHTLRMQARIRGALRGSTQPVVLTDLAQRLHAEQDVLLSTVQSMISSGELAGKMQGVSFTPQVCLEAQSAKVQGFFASNGFLPASVARSAGSTLQEWAQQSGAKGVVLPTAFLSAHLLDLARSSILEALNSGSWVDVQQLLPPALSVSDASEVLQQMAVQKRLPAGTVVVGHVAASRALLEEVAKSLKDEVHAAAERSLAGPSAGKTGKKPAQARAAADADDDGGSKKKGGKKPARGKKGRDDEDSDGATGVGGANDAVDPQVVARALAEVAPGVPAEAEAELCEKVQPLLAAMVAEAQSELRSSLLARQRGAFEQTERLVQENHEALALGLRALEALKLQDSPLQQHLLREVVTEPLHRLVAWHWEEAFGAPLEVTAANRKQCLDKLAAAVGARLDNLLKLQAAMAKGKDSKEAKDAKAPKGDKEAKDEKPAKKGGRSAKGEKDREAEEAEAADIAGLYAAAADDCHIFCRKVDKKREKAAVQEQRAHCREQLKQLLPSDAAKICWLGLRLATLAEGVPGLLFPAEPWGLRLVAQRLSDEALRDEALALCGLVESRSDPVALEAKAAAWKDRALGGKAASAAAEAAEDAA